MVNSSTTRSPRALNQRLNSAPIAFVNDPSIGATNDSPSGPNSTNPGQPPWLTGIRRIRSAEQQIRINF